MTDLRRDILNHDIDTYNYMSKVKKIVLTGGPCAGKTTALDTVVENFTRTGWKVFTVPEVPTMFTKGGMDYLTSNKAFFHEGEKATLEIQLALEEKFMRMAETQEGPTMVVCDRGTMDISAYMTPEMWAEITAAVGVDNQSMIDSYDLVLHLQTAADGLEQCYTTANNAQRLEQANEEGFSIARDLDHKVMEAWKSHPKHVVIKNNLNFGIKLAAVVSEIEKVLAE